MHSDTPTCGHGHRQHGKGCGGRGGRGRRNPATATEAGTETETHTCRRLLPQNTGAETGIYDVLNADAATPDEVSPPMAHGPRRHLHRRLRKGGCCTEARG
ncbi:MAG: hypothetical protein ABID63_10080 [Pseudomonadota bacterium]